MSYYDLDLEVIHKERPVKMLKQYETEFLEDRKTEMQTLKEFLTQSNLNAIKQIAHKWRGFSQPFGFNFLSESSIKLEEICEKKDIEECWNIYAKIQNYLEIKETIIRTTPLN